MIYDRSKKSCPGLHVQCINRVPLSSGLGSSSAALLTGMLGANAPCWEARSATMNILRLAIETEGHPDNVLAPASAGAAGALLLSITTMSSRSDCRRGHIVRPSCYRRPAGF